MTPKTRAEEVAGEIFLLLQLPCHYDPKNAIPKSAYEGVQKLISAFRNEALEEVIKELRNSHTCLHGCKCDLFVERIEKLKTPAEGEEKP